jgi:hypothetical protein
MSGLMRSLPAGGPTVEGFAEKSGTLTVDTEVVAKGVSILVVLVVVLVVVTGIPAAVLSWRSNARIGWNPAMRVLFSFFAFLMGIAYLINHLVHKLDLLRFIQGARPVQVQVPVAVPAPGPAPSPAPVSAPPPPSRPPYILTGP